MMQVDGGMTYGYYNRWREILCRMVHRASPSEIWVEPDKWRGKPFVHLINFSDCEGVIGTEACKVLAKDFADHQAIADKELEMPFFKQIFDKLRAAFEFAAAGNGAVVFS